MLNEKRNYIEYLILFFVGLLITAFVITNFTGIKGAVAHFFKILTPFYIGFGIAYILNRPISAVHNRYKIRRGIIIAVAYLGLIFLLSLFVVYALPKVVDSSVKMINEISSGAASLPGLFSQYDLGPAQEILYDNLNRLTDLLGLLSNFLIENIMKIFMSVTSTFFTIFFGVVISIYMLVDKDKIKGLASRVSKALIKEERADKFISFAGEVNEVFSHFLTGLIIEAIIVGFLAFIGFTLMGVKYAPILGVIICFTNVVPYIGPFIGAVPAVVATLMYDPIKALWVVVFIIILQQFDGNFIGPKVMGNYIGLDPIWIILSITIGGGFAGILGVILAIPTGAIIKIVLSRLLERREEKRQAEQVS